MTEKMRVAIALAAVLLPASAYAQVVPVSPAPPPPPPPTAPISQPLSPPSVPSGSHEPTWESATSFTVQVKDTLSMVIRAEDEDLDPLTYKVSGLPVGAKAEPGEGSVVVTWVPTEADVGSYTVVATASDGSHTIRQEIKLSVEQDEESFVVPGAGYCMYLPNNPDRLGFFQGARIEVLPAAWIHINEKRGASHGRVYASLDLMGSGKTGVHGAFVPALGFDLSFERSPNRRFLIPYFGVEVGILFQLETSTLGTVEPLAGLHVWATRNFWVNLSGSYLVPFTSEQFDDVRGVRGRLTIDFSLW